MIVLVAQLCLTPYNSMDCSPPSSSIHGTLQARIVKWAAIPVSSGSSLLRDRTRVSRIPARRFNLWATRVVRNQTWLSVFTLTFHLHALEKEMATYSSVLAWRIPGTGEPGGLPSMGSHRVGHDWSDLAAAADHPYLLLGSWWSVVVLATDLQEVWLALVA